MEVEAEREVRASPSHPVNFAFRMRVGVTGGQVQSLFLGSDQRCEEENSQ